MAARLNTWTTEEVRSVVRFLNAKCVSPAEIHKQLVEIYGQDVMSKKQVYTWCTLFANGRTSVSDQPRSGRPISSASDDNVVMIDALVQEDRRVKIRTIAETLNISKSCVHRIVHDTLGYRKVCARWVPKQLTESHKETRMVLCLNHLERYHREGEEFLQGIVTGDETWVHYSTPESKRDSMTWKHVTSPPPKKFKLTASTKKLMATIFWDCAGVLLVRFHAYGQPINAARYCETLDQLRQSIRKKRPGMISRGVVLLHDNATPHTATATREWLNRYKWETLEHPPHSPDLAPSDFHLFGPLKKHLSGRAFKDEEQLKSAVKHYMSLNDQQFYKEGFDSLVVRWDKCINKFGDYVEK